MTLPNKASISEVLPILLIPAHHRDRFFFHVMASLAQMERELTIERTRAGLETAKKLGRRGGRRRQMTDSKIESAKKLLAGGMPPRDVAENLVFRFLRFTDGYLLQQILSVIFCTKCLWCPYISDPIIRILC